MMIWPFDPNDRKRPNLLDQMPAEVRADGRFEALVKGYLSDEIGKWGAELLAGIDIYELLETGNAHV